MHSGISCFDNKVGRDLIFVEAMVSSFKDWFHKIVGDVIFDKFISHFKTEQYNDEELKVLSEAYDKITDAFKYVKRKLKHFEEHLSINLELSKNQQTPLLPESITIKTDLIAQMFNYVSKSVCQYKISVNGRDPLSDEDTFPFLIVFDEASVLSEVDPINRLSTL